MNTKLHEEAKSGDDIIVNDQSDLLVKNLSGETPFLVAVKSLNRYAMMQLYHKDVINMLDDQGYYPSYYIFTKSKSIPLINQFMQMSPDLNVEDMHGKDALYYFYSNLDVEDCDIIFADRFILIETFRRLDDFKPYPLYNFLVRRSILHNY